MKKVLFILLLVGIIPLATQAQSKDTVYINKVHYVSVLIDPVTERIKKTWIRSKKVKSGYIVKVDSGWYKVNGRILQVCDIEKLKADENRKHKG